MSAFRQILSFLFLFIPAFTISAQDAQFPELKADFFKRNRQNLRAAMPNRSVALIFSSVEKVRSNDVNYPFQQDPNFYYLTGLNEPDAMLILFKEPYETEEDTVTEMIFVPPSSKEFELWNGKRLGSHGAETVLGIEKAFANTAFPDYRIRFDHFDEIHYSVPEGSICDDPSYRGDLASMMKHFKFKTDSLSYRVENRLLSAWIAELREIKHREEIELIQKAIDITCSAHENLMKSIDTTYTEYRAEALIEFTFRDLGAEGEGFPSIVGGGENTCVLHYTANNADLTDGDLLVVDIGAQYRNYTADVTRTIPVNGKFSPEQKQIYDLVLAAQKAGIEKCRKGNKFWDPHDAATAVIQEGLRKLGITKKSWEAKKYFQHGTSHYLGLDVHDAGSYQPLVENSILTVEPGIYIPAGSDCDEKWWNIGIRIEDDILVTSGDPVNLSSCVARETEDIEANMSK